MPRRHRRCGWRGERIAGHSVGLLLDPVLETLRTLTPLRPKIAPSRLGEEAVLLGALATALGTAPDVVFERRSAMS
jgi:hypothetical protein